MTKTNREKVNNKNLIWIDLEFSGLDFNNDTILEIATIVTDEDLNIIDYGPNIAIRTEKEILENMDQWNTEHHNDSGLVQKCLDSKIDLRKAEKITIEFLSKYLDSSASPICGNSVSQDRRMLAKRMPHLEHFFHYRTIDVSTIKELMKRWAPHIKEFKKDKTHTALRDIEESIGELKYYRKKFFKIEK